MTARKTPLELAISKAVRKARSAAPDRRASVPTRRRPTVLLTVNKPLPGEPPDPEPGTLAIEAQTATLYVGRGWRPARGETASFAESLLGLYVLEIVGTTGVAGQRTRKYLRACWHLGDVIASGRYTDDDLTLTRRTLNLL